MKFILYVYCIILIFTFAFGQDSAKQCLKINKITQIKFSADSSILDNIDTHKLTKTEYLKTFIIGKNDNIYSLIKPKMFFYEYNRFQINQNIICKIIYTTQPENMQLDGKLKLLFLVTFNKNNQQIGVIRIAKIEEGTDNSIIETSNINNFEINKKTHEISIAEDGSVVNSNLQEQYEITLNGLIQKKLHK